MYYSSSKPSTVLYVRTHCKRRAFISIFSGKWMREKVFSEGAEMSRRRRKKQKRGNVGNKV